MAEFIYLGSWTDSIRILEVVLSDGTSRAVPDMFYPSPAAPTFDAVDDALLAALELTGKLYIFGHYSQGGPQFAQQSAGPKAGQFYIFSTRGGPALGLYLARQTESGLLGFGSLGYEKEYLNPTSGVWERPSGLLKDEYKRLTREVRRHVSRHSFPKMSAWVGKDGLDKLNRGELRVEAKGLV